MSGNKEMKIDMPRLVHDEPKEQPKSTTTSSGGGFFGEHKILIICCTIVVIVTIIIICVYYWGKRDLVDIPMFNRKTQQQREEEKLRKENEEEMIKLRNIQRAKRAENAESPETVEGTKTSNKTVRFADQSTDKKDEAHEERSYGTPPNTNVTSSVASQPGGVSNQSPVASSTAPDLNLESHQNKLIAGK